MWMYEMSFFVYAMPMQCNKKMCKGNIMVSLVVLVKVCKKFMKYIGKKEFLVKQCIFIVYNVYMKYVQRKGDQKIENSWDGLQCVGFWYLICVCVRGKEMYKEYRMLRIKRCVWCGGMLAFAGFFKDQTS